MKYNIEYPYYGITSSRDRYFVIIKPTYAVVLEHKGTHGFGFSAYISRNKILDLYKFSHKITKQEFEDTIRNNIQKFFLTVPGVEILTAAPGTKLLQTKDGN